MVELALKRNVETRVVGAGAVIGEVQRLVDEAVEIDLSALASRPARMLQHAPDDAVGPTPMLGDLFEVAGERVDDLFGLATPVAVQHSQRRSHNLLQFVQQLDR